MARPHRRLSLALLCLLALSGLPGAAIQAQDAPKVAGADVPAPKRTKTVLPEYPPEAQAQGIRGIVILEIVIGVQGRVDTVSVVRSIAGLDEAAMAAVRKWEYDVTKFEGKPVSVRLTVPITFALKVPEVFRQDGVPVLRQGAAPAFPGDGTQGSPTTVSAEVTLDIDGAVADVVMTSGEPPWTESVLQALRTWKFAVEEPNTLYTFRVEAQFTPGAKGEHGKVDLRLSNPRKSQAKAAPGEEPAAATPSEPAALPPPPSPTPAAPPAPPSAPPPTAPAPPAATAPGPPPSQPPAAAAPAPSAVAPAVETETLKAAPPPATKAAQPPIETLLAPPPKPAAPAVIENGVSAIHEVALSPGVPDLVKGRRPVPPPMARMAGTTGTVEVRFSVNAAGGTTVVGAEGPEVLRPAAEEAVLSWSFRRASAERLHLVAAFEYRTEGASATVHVDPHAQP